MRIGRTLVALIILFAGVMALLVLRYDAWVYTGMLDHPIIMAGLAGVAALLATMLMFHRVPDPKRAVTFDGGRFHRLDPRGEILVWPGQEIGTEVSLAEQRVLGWPVMFYDREGKEHMVLMALTWRIVPTSQRPGLREQRMLLMHNSQRRRIALEAVESVVRNIARSLTFEEMRVALVHPGVIEGIRKQASLEIQADALTIDRLHVVRLVAEEKKDDPKPVKETHTIEQKRDWDASVPGAPPDWRGLMPVPGMPVLPAPAPLNEVVVHAGGGSSSDGGGGDQRTPQQPAPEHQQAGEQHEVASDDANAGTGTASEEHASREATKNGKPASSTPAASKPKAEMHDEIKRTQEDVRGIVVKDDKDKDKPAPGHLSLEAHAAIVQTLAEGMQHVRPNVHPHKPKHPTGREILDAALRTSTFDVLVRSRVREVLRILDLLDAFCPPGVTDATKEAEQEACDASKLLSKHWSDSQDLAKIKQDMEHAEKTYRMRGNTPLANGCVVATHLLEGGEKTIYSTKFMGEIPAYKANPKATVGNLITAMTRGAIIGSVRGAIAGPVVAMKPELRTLPLSEQKSLIVTADDGAIAMAVEESVRELY